MGDQTTFEFHPDNSVSYELNVRFPNATLDDITEIEFDGEMVQVTIEQPDEIEQLADEVRDELEHATFPCTVEVRNGDEIVVWYNEGAKVGSLNYRFANSTLESICSLGIGVRTIRSDRVIFKRPEDARRSVMTAEQA